MSAIGTGPLDAVFSRLYVMRAALDAYTALRATADLTAAERVLMQQLAGHLNGSDSPYAPRCSCGRLVFDHAPECATAPVLREWVAREGMGCAWRIECVLSGQPARDELLVACALDPRDREGFEVRYETATLVTTGDLELLPRTARVWSPGLILPSERTALFEAAVGQDAAGVRAALFHLHALEALR